jgi:cullin 3
MPKRNLQGLTKDDIDFDATWSILETALKEIHTKNASKLSFEELYRAAYKIVLKKKAELLYQKVSNLEEEWLRDQVKVRVGTFITPSLLAGAPAHTQDGQANERRVAGERFMKVLKDCFEDHQLCMSMITDVLMYMVSLMPFIEDGAALNMAAGPSVLCRPAAALNIHYSINSVSKRHTGRPSLRTRLEY